MKNVFRKLNVLFATLFLSLVIFTSCNAGLGLGTFNFNCAHISVGTKDVCVEVESWHENELGCELKLRDGTSIYCAEGTYILIDGTCPICKQ